MGVLDGRVAIVTAGAGAGMGHAISSLLAREGAAVVVADINPDACARTVAAIERDGGRAISAPTDVSKAADVDRMVATTLEAFGKISILANHAGAGRGAPIEAMTEAMWDHVTGVHLKGTYLCTRAVVPHMKAQRWGRVVSTVSRAGYRTSRGLSGLTAYAASKYAVVGFSRALAMELGPWNITMNCVAPGLVEAGGMGGDSGTNGMSPEEMHERSDHEGQILDPLRYVRPDEIAGTWLYLVGPHADRVTGATFHVNGGSYFGG